MLYSSTISYQLQVELAKVCKNNKQWLLALYLPSLPVAQVPNFAILVLAWVFNIFQNSRFTHTTVFAQILQTHEYQILQYSYSHEYLIFFKILAALASE